METRQAVHPEQARHFDTDSLRRHFLIQELFETGKAKLVYSYYDRLIIGGAVPDTSLELQVDKAIIGSEYLLERRELGAINIGAAGLIKVDGQEFLLESRDALYIGLGAREISFSSRARSEPARFYFLSAPAHRAFPTMRISIRESQPLALGSDEESNRRTIYKYIHPDGVKSCQLVMGLTLLEPKNVWNTMPVHTHERRVEVYLYFDIPKEGVLFHLMGEPGETRHLVVRNEEAVLSPSWSIHSGVGTSNYAFIWGMAGENQVFSDMDGVAMSRLR
jgi:4-deoxy-L-threo-5-hexosulose-uronate ketol-isomerase